VIALLVMTDGRRDCISRTIPAALEQLDGPITTRIIHDDSGDLDYGHWVHREFPDWTYVGGGIQRRGFGGAIANAWAYLDRCVEPYVLHLEDDFIITRPVHLPAMMDVLRAWPHLTQLALLRQPVNDQERAAGGVIEQHPGDYKLIRWHDYAWRQHRRHWTTNPSLYRRSLSFGGWPDGPESEGRFGLDLFAEHPQLHSAYWGDSGEWCEHIGDVRAGTGY
jgi:hypothetical protein